MILPTGSISTPAILLRSGIKKKNDGRNLKLRPTTAVADSLDQPINLWEDPPQTCKVTKHNNLDGDHHGIWLEAVPAYPELYARASPRTAGEKHKKLMSEMLHSLASIVLVNEQGSGKVSIDKHGGPVYEYRMSSADKE